MKINDLFVQQAQLDEVSLGGIGRGIAKGVGAVSRGVGAVAGGVAGAVDAAAQGFAGGRAAVSGQPTAQTTPATNTTSNTPATNATSNTPATPNTTTTSNATAPAGNAPASGTTAKGTADFGTIQRSIKTLSPNQKKALAGQLAGKAPATSAPAATAPATPAATAPAGPQKGQEVALASGEKYKFMGQQWVEVDPTTGAEVGGAALPAGFQKSLTGIAAKQQAASATDAGTPNLRVVDGGKAAVAEGLYFRSKFLNAIL
jgi:hypothetical protein